MGHKSTVNKRRLKFSHERAGNKAEELLCKPKEQKCQEDKGNQMSQMSVKGSKISTKCSQDLVTGGH